MKLLWQPGDEYLLAGDEVVASKAGEAAVGKDGIFQRSIPGLAFFVFSLVNIRKRCSSPIQVEQVVGSAEEKAACKAKAKARKEKKPPSEKRKPGRPKGSKNKAKQTPELNPELQRGHYSQNQPEAPGHRSFCLIQHRPGIAFRKDD